MTKILLVEDDKSLREIYGVRLLAEGYDIVSAGDGEEALAMAIKERPRLILSDVMMPKISGFDMLDILRSTTETKDVKVIIMTALSSEDQRKRGEQLGADKYLVKSQVGIEDVVRAVHETLGDLPGVGTNPVPVSQPAHTYEPVAPTPQPTPAPQPVTRPDISSLSPQPAAPAATPTASVVNPLIQQHPQQAFAPAPQPLSQPAQVPAPQPIPMPQPQPTTLPQPMAPFSSPAPRPSGLGDRVIQPLPADDSQNSVDISKLMAQELDNTQNISQPTPEPQPAQVPAPQPIPMPQPQQPTPNPIEQVNIIPPVQTQPQEQNIPHQPSENPQSTQFPPINPQQ